MDKNYCRLCLKQDTWNSPLSVFADYEILSKIFLVHGIKILESDSFSKVICHLCLAKLEFMDGVRKKVAISNSILNGIVQTGESSRLSTETQTVPQLDGEQQATELCCDKCEFSTDNTSLLLAHVELHNSVATRNCPRCPATVLTEDSLALHLKRKHKNRTLVIHYCSQCAKLVYGNEQFSKHCQQHGNASGTQSRTTKKKHKRDKVKAKPVTDETPRERIVLKISKTASNDDDSNGQVYSDNNNPKPSVTSVKDNAQTNRNHSQTSVNSIKDSVKDDAQTNENNFQASVNSIKDSVKDDAQTNRNNFQASVNSIKDSVKDDAQTNENNFQTSVNSIKGYNSVTSIKDNAQTNKNHSQTSFNSIKGHNSVASIKDNAQTNKNHSQTSVTSVKDSVKDDAQTNKNNFRTSVTSNKDSVTNIKVDSQTNKYNVQTLVSTKLQTLATNKENFVQTTGRSEASQTTPAKKRRMSGAECCDLVKESNFVAVDGPECCAAKKDASVDKEVDFVGMKRKIEEARRKAVAKTSNHFGTADESMGFDLIDSDLETDEIYSKQDNDKWMMSDTNGNRLESSLLSSVHNRYQGWRQSVSDDNKAGLHRLESSLLSSVHKQSHVVGERQSLSDDKVGQQMDSDIQVAVDEWDPGSASQRIYIDVDEDDDVIDCSFRTSSGDSCGSFASLEIEDVIEIKDEYLSD